MINKEVKGIIMLGHQYNCLVCNPPTLPLPGKELKGVVSFRDIYDVEYMQSEAGKSKKEISLIMRSDFVKIFFAG
jgi:nitrite reductase (NADH) large subunit